MSLLVVYHAGYSFGHYCFSDDIEGTPGALCSWGAGPGCVLWTVAYFGRLIPDPQTRNGIILTGMPQLSQLSQVPANG